MKKNIFAFLCLLSLISCKPEISSDYQAFLEASPKTSILVVNGNAETLSAIDIETEMIFNNIQTIGHSGTNPAIPNDIFISQNNINLLLSGQNSIESYKINNLDYIDKGRHYFKNAYNPMIFIPVLGTSLVFVTGLNKDQIQAVDIFDLQVEYPFSDCFTRVELPDNAHSETKVAPTKTNATGDNKPRSATGGTVLLNGSESILYVTNIRYDSSILMTSNDKLSEYSGNKVRAPGYFREATLSIFTFDVNSIKNGYKLIKEVNLEATFYQKAKLFDGLSEYFPGNGLNSQSAFILDGKLNIICTGTNGGSRKRYSDSEFIPMGFDIGDVKPGTNPDDGLILILDIDKPEDPQLIKWLNIGGSPKGFREAIDTDNKIVYLAGVGGIQAYHYASDVKDYKIIKSSSDMLLKAKNTEKNYYSGLCYASTCKCLYVSSYTEDSVNTIQVSGSYPSIYYSDGKTFQTGYGPGALCILER